MRRFCLFVGWVARRRAKRDEDEVEEEVDEVEEVEGIKSAEIKERRRSVSQLDQSSKR